MPKVNGFTRTQGEAARELGVHINTLRLWRQQGCPGKTPRGWSLQAIREWRATHLRPLLPAQDMVQPRIADPSRPPDPEYRWKEARAALAETRLSRERGALVELEAHERIVLRLCAVFRAGLQGLIPTLAAQLEGLDERARVANLETRFADLLKDVAANAGRGVTTAKKKRRGATPTKIGPE